MPTDFYDVLGAPADASSEELKRAYRGRVREYHPDVNDHPDGDQQFKLIRIANDVLSQGAERKDYDRLGHREYVEKHLDDEVPPFSVLPEFEEADDIPTSRSESSTDSATATAATETGTNGTTSRSRSSTSTSTNGSTTNRSTSRSGSSGTSSSTSTSQSDSGEASTASASTERGRSNGSTETSRSTRRTAAGAERSESSQWEDVAEDTTNRTRSTSTTPAGVRRRRGLRRWYVVAVVALLSYVGGIGSYLLQYRPAAETLLTNLIAAPVPTLTGPFPLVSPTAYSLAAAESVIAGEPGLSLLFLAGVALLPLVVLTAVAQFGHGSAWAYALASLGPVATLAAVPFVVLPTAAVLVGLAVLPLISGLGFLVDVGRYLLATR